MATQEDQALACKNEGNKALAAQDYDGAIAHFSEGLLYTPDNAVLYSNRAAAYASKGEWEKSLEDAWNAISHNPTWGKAYSRKALALLQLNRFEQAIACCKEGLQHEPDNSALQASLADANNYLMASENNVLAEEQLSRGKHKNALALLDKSVELHPQNALYWSNRSAAALGCGRFQQAEEDAQKVMWLKPQWHKGYQRMAELKSAERKHEEACQWYASALKIMPGDSTLLSAFSRAQQDLIFEKTRQQAASSSSSGEDKSKAEEEKKKAESEQAGTSQEPVQEASEKRKSSKFFGFL